MTKAFAPGHITCFFSAHLHQDPSKTGSRGGGIVIDDGVTATVSKANETQVIVNGEPRFVGVVERLLRDLDIEARVELENEIPVGSGFGASGASALASALAANKEYNLDKTRDELVRHAHIAEVREGTGLGDVVPQSIGGIVIRTREGDIGHGLFSEIDTNNEYISYSTYGELDTNEILSDTSIMKEINKKGENTLKEFKKEQTTEKLVDLGWRFALETNLTTEKIRSIIEDLRNRGKKGSMAMLGETAYCLGKTDSLDKTTSISDTGAYVIQ